ncbi:MAG TPA: glycosyl hydrolase, partial [Bacteroidales bacterium]|nr:glycosyl hydrolase [Bacteroidales bacterium]
THDAEAADRPFDLPENQEEKVQFCSTHNANTVVIVTSGSGINMSAWNKVSAILYTWYLGQNGAQAVAEILSGSTNPSGKLPISIEKSFNHSPAFGYIPQGEKLYSGVNLSSQKIDKTYDITYSEGIFMGYRWYESKNIAPLFPFGFGLSYTTFEYSNLSISNEQIAPNQTLKLTLTVKNTGDCKGSETVQLYVSDLKCSVPRPIKELKGFEKVSLNIGESKEITFVLNPNDFAFWHPETKTWTVEEGEFELLVGASSTAIRLKKTVFIKK